MTEDVFSSALALGESDRDKDGNILQHDLLWSESWK